MPTKAICNQNDTCAYKAFALLLDSPKSCLYKPRIESDTPSPTTFLQLSSLYPVTPFYPRPPLPSR
ncbi:unnamed protein product [Coffea canephora]|uniref:Uncharacterized protein n=1 Tax=Coffea canephora TaxID=49390 RepID=A0A068TT89_COFCA|nr:unnamed protein product [Coffea canephora]